MRRTGLFESAWWKHVQTLHHVTTPSSQFMQNWESYVERCMKMVFGIVYSPDCVWGNSSCNALALNFLDHISISSCRPSSLARQATPHRRHSTPPLWKAPPPCGHHSWMWWCNPCHCHVWSMNWLVFFLGKITGTSHISWENHGKSCRCSPKSTHWRYSPDWENGYAYDYHRENRSKANMDGMLLQTWGRPPKHSLRH